MRISAESCETLTRVLWSHLAAVGLPFDQTLANYPELRKALQELSAGEPGLRQRERRRGRPARGRIVFREERIDDLPSECTVSDVCKHLGVRPATVYGWIDKGGLRVTRLNPSGALLIDKDILVSWLDRTKRLPSTQTFGR